MVVDFERSIKKCVNVFRTPSYVVYCHDFPPVESSVDKEYLWDTLGTLGWKLMSHAYDPDYVPSSSGMEENRSIMFNFLEEEVSLAQSVFDLLKARRQPRKNPCCALQTIVSVILRCFTWRKRA